MRVELIRKAQRNLHRQSLTKAAVAKVRPVVDAALVDDGDVLQAVTGQVAELHTRIGEADVRESVWRTALNSRCALGCPAFDSVVEVALERGAGSQNVSHSIAGEIEQTNLRVFQVERRRLCVALERLAAEARVEVERVVARHLGRGDQKVGPAIPIGVEQLHALIGKLQAPGRLAEGARHVEPALAEVTPISRRSAAEFQYVGQAVAEEVYEFDVRVRQRRRGQSLALQGDKASLGGSEARVAEVQRRHFAHADALVIEPDDVDTREQRRAIAQARVGPTAMLVGIDEFVGVNEEVVLGIGGRVSAHDDPFAAAAGADLEAGAVV